MPDYSRTAQAEIFENEAGNDWYSYYPAYNIRLKENAFCFMPTYPSQRSAGSENGTEDGSSAGYQYRITVDEKLDTARPSHVAYLKEGTVLGGRVRYGGGGWKECGPQELDNLIMEVWQRGPRRSNAEGFLKHCHPLK